MTIRTAVCPAVVLAMALTAAAGETLESVEKKIIEQEAALRSIQCTARFTSQTLTDDSVANLAAEYKMESVRKPGSKPLYRLEAKVKVKITGKEASSPEQVFDVAEITVDDGRAMYVLHEEGDDRKVEKSPGGSCTGLFDAKTELADMHKEGTGRLLPDATAEGRETWVVESLRRAPTEESPSIRTVRHYDKKTGIPLKTLGYDKTGKLVETRIVTDLKTNIDIPAERFVFKVPPGVPVVDKSCSADSPASEPSR